MATYKNEVNDLRTRVFMYEHGYYSPQKINYERYNRLFEPNGVTTIRRTNIERTKTINNCVYSTQSNLIIVIV